MCDFGASTYIALAAAAASAATGAVAANQSNKAQSAAVAAESLRQQQMQQRQQNIIAQQESEKESARQIFQNLVPEGGQQRMEEREKEIGTQLGAAYTAAAAPTPGSDPTRDGDAVSTVGAPTNAGTGTPKAFDAAYAQQLARVLGFNTQQANARANMDALGIAQNRASQAIQRGNEGINLNGQTIAGLGRNVQGIGALMDASNRDAQAQINAASHKGDNWKTASQVFGIISSLAGGGMDFGGNAYGQSQTAKKTSAQTLSTPTHDQRYYSTSTGARIN